MNTAITNWPLSLIPGAVRCRELADSPDDVLRTLAKHLDLPMEDAETVGFLREALRSTHDELRLAQAKYRVQSLQKKIDAKETP